MHHCLPSSNDRLNGGVWTWKAMGYWAPIQQLRFRGGLQKAVRAPNVRELFEEPTVDAGGIADPCSPVFGLIDDPAIAAACARNGGVGLSPDEEVFFPLETRSGSTDLKAETARTLTLGVVAQPLRGLNLTVDYYDIDIKDTIGTFGGGAQFTLFGCIRGGGDPADPLCQAYQRAPSGEVTQIDLPTANLARLRARGIDWQMAYGFPLPVGAIRLNLSGTRLLSSEIELNRNIGAIDCGGAFGGICGGTIGGSATPKWKLFNRAAWTAGPVTLSLRHRFFSSTRNSRFAGAEVLGFPPPTNLPTRARRLEARHYFDLASSFAINRRYGLTLGVNNLTNRKPSLLGSQQIQANTDPSLYDVLGRRFFVSINARLR
ncbi:MAG: TonB-dependent receptor [Sphingomicrobium sp.]